MTTPIRFGKYEVVGSIGEGGFGKVYRGRDPDLKRAVAIKTCAASDLDLRRRFMREAEIVARLNHPNITTIYDVGTEGEVPYLVQELLSGEDLQALIRQGGVPGGLPEALRILRAVAEGLAYAHRQGVVHRDIKPANLRVLDDGSVKIMDFGIAKLQNADHTLTQAGTAMGTSGYLPPEQLRGEPVDHRADLFSFGATAYELLSGHRPFDGGDISRVLYRIVHEEPPPLGTVAPQCPPALERLVSRCLSKQPSGRPADFSAVIAELDALAAAGLAGSTADHQAPTILSTGPVSGTVTAGRGARAAPRSGDSYRTAIHPRRWGWVGMAAALLVAAGAVALWWWPQGGPVTELAGTAEPSAQPVASPPESTPPSASASPGASLGAGTQPGADPAPTLVAPPPAPPPTPQQGDPGHDPAPVTPSPAPLNGTAGPETALPVPADLTPTPLAAPVGPVPEPEGAPLVPSGPVPLAVLALGLTAETHARYPQLADASVGFGIHNRVVQALDDTGRFRLVEDNPKILKDMIDNQWLAAGGALASGAATSAARRLGARFVVYGEVFEFGLRELSRKEREVRVGLQLRLVDVQTTEYVPASTSAVVRTRGPVLEGEQKKDFARSAVGEATATAITQAVRDLISKATARGFLPAAGGSP